ncbi:tRNA (adenosine(37)-N6)-threonylcarbamoyltransferase complex dimerization subunit type 1 TsaB [Shewanella surugensis]|uniref:tRNA threonylcarbamoyladenosine biosynthesis protein TsaB n=1 Tax=Shewanella surugensis TaxID=212020 RepID=A0ABT0LC60_9GAMM|nr:tRNA (adenosine(37)-N6)-threonylcarbamoyltransferase complex dimerization subunit type 1 TsaB [Shewanella surugensis]MCL1125272.1 tRNA (adenosine(37)-N6)-threonylcarbamoyltransferase complex dimerization subunit type 1 TsaB [Shewanella surugensis]
MTQEVQITVPSIILALDTCTESCSVALTVNGVVYQEQVDAPREHSQRLLPMLDSVLKQAQVVLKDVGLIAYGRGPGSFTGIRICISMTQGLALGLDIPVIGISTLATMAQIAIAEHGASQVFCAIDARMGEVYWGQFIDVEGIATLVGEERVSRPEDVALQLELNAPIMCAGTGFDAYPQLLTLSEHALLCEQATFPQAHAMLGLAELGFKQGDATSVDELAPVYLRDTVTWKKLPGRG